MPEQHNGGSLTNPKTWSQIVAAMPVTIGILVILGIQLYITDQNNRDNRLIERDELKAQKDFNSSIDKLFGSIAESSKRNADAMESIARDSKQEVEEVKRMNQLLEQLLKN